MADGADAEIKKLEVDPDSDGQRFDIFLAQKFSQISRVQLRRLINASSAKVDGKRQKASYRVRTGQLVDIEFAEVRELGPQPENVPLDVLFEDEHMVAINKPPHMVVHPSKGHWSGTLTAALAFHFQNLSTVGGPTRPGIVHRLDRDTSGVILVAKTDQAHLRLAKQFENRSIEKEYFAVSRGTVDRDRDTIEQPIGCHPYHREKMAIRARHSTSREAKTFFEVQERFVGFTTFRVFPKTGRTHQIRIHLAHIGCPVLCDPLYSGQSQFRRRDLTGIQSDGDATIFDRLALHAKRIKFAHPMTGLITEIETDLPADLVSLVDQLRNHG